MCKVANISPEPFKSLLPPFGDVNTDDITDRESYPSPQVAAIQPAEEPATTADITQSIDASESVEELGNQRKPADAEKGMILLVNKNDDITTGSRIKSMGDALFDEFGGADANLDANESPFDTESEIKFIGKEVPKFIYIGSQVNEGDTQGTGLSIFDQIIKDSIKQALPKFDKRVKKTLNAEIPELLIKPLNNDFNLLNKKEDNQNLWFVLIDSASALAKVVPEGEKMSTQENIDSEIIGELHSEQAPPTSTALVVQSSEEEPLVKKVQFTMPELVPNFTIPSPTPLNSIMPQGIRPLIIINNIPFKQYTTTLFSSSSSEFSQLLLHKIVDKGKSEATNEDLMKQLMPFIEQGGSGSKDSKSSTIQHLW
ncbi:hypothetical protein Tco_1276903 [Tanacetum coccineum]